VSLAGRELAARTTRRTDDGRIRLGYFSGSATHDEDWRAIEPAVTALMHRDPRVELWLVGPLSTSTVLDRFGDRVTRVLPVPWQDLPQLLAQVDVNLAPLEATPFTAGKSAIKWLEAALVGTPTIATATPPFRDAVVDGETGLLVEPGADWSDALARVCDEPHVARLWGVQSRSSALSAYSPEMQADRYHAYFSAVLEAPRASVDLGALRAARADEGFPRGLGLDLEPYPFEPALASLELDPPRGAEAIATTRRGVRRTALTGRRYYRGAARRLTRMRPEGDR